MTTALSAPRLITDRLDHHARTKPDVEAMRYGEESWTWSQWQERIRRTAGALRASGVTRGDRVAFFDKNHPACLETTIAAASLGAANAVVNWRLSAREVAYILNDCGARLLFVGAELAGVLDEIRDTLTSVERVVVVGGAGDEFEGWRRDAEPVSAQPDVVPDDTCVLLYTSGTTGFPKGAMLTHRAMTAHAEALTSYMPFVDTDRVLVAMPLFHVGGTSYSLVGVHNGVTMTMLREADPAALFGAIAGGATHAFLVPAVVAGIVGAGAAAQQAFGRMKSVCYGAAPMPLPIVRAAMKAWPDTEFLQVYGMTELCGVVTTLEPPEHRDVEHPERLLSAGKPIPGVTMRVVDPATLADVPAGASGELWWHSDQRMAGYWQKPEATADTLTADGWIRSGDVGYVDADGYVYVVDRVKDMIISGGENIYGPEVEQVIIEHPGVAEVAVIGVPDPKWGETVKAVVALAPRTQVTEAELIAFTRANLAHFKCPSSVDFVAALPRNGTGKVLKRDLRAPYWTDRPRSV